MNDQIRLDRVIELLAEIRDLLQIREVPITAKEIRRRVQAEQQARDVNRGLEGAGGMKHQEDRFVD